MRLEGTVIAVVVTHDRLEHLKKCLKLLGEQTRPPDGILVVDSASSDGTPEFLAGLGDEVFVLRSEANIGGAGGFHIGIKEGWSRGYDWMWLMDDDSAPSVEALEKLLGCDPPNGAAPMLLSSRVLWPGDNRLHPMNAPRPKLESSALTEAISDGLMPLRSTSFVSCLLHRSAIDRYGLPHADYFVWNDDLEYTARVLRRDVGFWVPGSVVYHETPDPHVVGAAQPSKFYFEVRNKLFMLRTRSWSPYDRLRWAKSLVSHTLDFLRHHHFSGESVAAVARGLRDGLRRRG